MFILSLILLIFAPIIAYQIARRKFPDHVFCISGVVFGTIVSPFSLGVYALFFLSKYGVALGMIGLILTSIHEFPGFHLALYFGVVLIGDVVSEFPKHIIIETINASIWAIFYGLLGHGIDYLRNRTRRDSVF